MKNLNLRQKTSALVTLAILVATLSSTPALSAKKAVGKATIYSSKFSGRKTASGERYKPQAISAASNKFPIGSKVLVKNKKTGKSAIVKINDHTAKSTKAPVDLSQGAANKLGVKGTAPVEATMVGKSK